MSDRASIEAARIDSDEDGWHLILDTDLDGTLDFRIPHQVAVELDRSMSGVREHEAERRSARREYEAGCDVEPDPDHPDPELLAEAGDRLRKQRREEGR